MQCRCSTLAKRWIAKTGEKLEEVIDNIHGIASTKAVCKKEKR